MVVSHRRVLYAGDEIERVVIILVKQNSIFTSTHVRHWGPDINAGKVKGAGETNAPWTAVALCRRT